MSDQPRKNSAGTEESDDRAELTRRLSDLAIAAQTVTSTDRLLADLFDSLLKEVNLFSR